MFFCFSFVYIDNQIDVLVQVYVCFFLFFLLDLYMPKSLYECDQKGEKTTTFKKAPMPGLPDFPSPLPNVVPIF